MEYLSSMSTTSIVWWASAAIVGAFVIGCCIGAKRANSAWRLLDVEDYRAVLYKDRWHHIMSGDKYNNMLESTTMRDHKNELQRQRYADEHNG